MKILAQLQVRRRVLAPLIPAVLIGVCTGTMNLGAYGAQFVFIAAGIPTNLVVGLPAYYLFNWKPATPEGQTTYMVLLMVANMYVLAAVMRLVKRLLHAKRPAAPGTLG